MHQKNRSCALIDWSRSKISQLPEDSGLLDGDDCAKIYGIEITFIFF